MSLSMKIEEALKQSGLKAEECVFIDNSVSNLDKPSEMGFTMIFWMMIKEIIAGYIAMLLY